MYILSAEYRVTAVDNVWTTLRLLFLVTIKFSEFREFVKNR